MAEGEEQDKSQKTEEPSQKKLEESRKKGQVALSREVNNFTMIFAGALVVVAFGPYLGRQFRAALMPFIEKPHDLINIGEVLSSATLDIFAIMAFPVLIFIVAAVAGPMAQVGLLFAPQAIKPQLSRISPIKGIKRLFSLRSLVEFVKGIFKLVVISAVAYVVLTPFFGTIDHMVQSPLDLMIADLVSLVAKFLIGVLVVLFLVAGLDLFYQRYDHNQNLRMTRQEVKDEYKQTEGDPHVKAKLRQLRMERARTRMMQAVPESDVVITNPTHYSIVLKYKPEEGMDAPICTAKGVDELAMRLRERAKEFDIPLVENKPLARALFDTVEVNEKVPQEHYEAVARVISYVFKLKNRQLPKQTS